MFSTTALPARDTSEGTDAANHPMVEWLERFSAALTARSSVELGRLFETDSTVRDLLALSWDFRNAVGRDAVVALLTDADTAPLLRLKVRRGATNQLDTEAADRSMAAFIEFTTTSGAGEGYVRLMRGSDGDWRAATLVLSLSSIVGHTERVEEHRPMGRAHGPIPGRQGWRESEESEFETTDPAVVILGAGHNGLMLAARLRALGISALILESNAHVGDNWRRRYASLALHTPLAADQLPYLPFPSTWTRFTPKDKLGDFLESYATLLDLPVWTSTRVESAEYDHDAGHWNVSVLRGDGQHRQLQPRHFVFATGMNGAPRLPSLAGKEQFQGKVIHAAEYQGFGPWIGKRVVVVGCGVSGHDIAQDLAEHGVDVTMVQRSGTVVLSTKAFHEVMHATHTSGRYSLAEGDLINAAVPFGALPSYGAEQLRAARLIDDELLSGLEDAGFQLSQGPSGQGVLGLIFGLNTTGYYYNAGASDLIIDGSIKLRRGGVTGLDSSGVVLSDGTTLDADLVVFATGYEPPTTAVRDVLGDAIADQLGEFASVGADGEYGSLWRRSGVDGLWFMISLSIEHGRFYSKHLALQIAADEAHSTAAR